MYSTKEWMKAEGLSEEHAHRLVLLGAHGYKDAYLVSGLTLIEFYIPSETTCRMVCHTKAELNRAVKVCKNAGEPDIGQDIQSYLEKAPPAEIPDDMDEPEDDREKEFNKGKQVAGNIVSALVNAANKQREKKKSKTIAEPSNSVVNILGILSKYSPHVARGLLAKSLDDETHSIDEMKEAKAFLTASKYFNADKVKVLDEVISGAFEELPSAYSDDDKHNDKPASEQPALPGMDAHVMCDWLVMIHDHENGAAEPQIVHSATDEGAIRIASDVKPMTPLKIKLLPFSCRPWKTYLCGGGNVAVSVAKASDFGRIVYRAAKVEEMIELVGE